MFDQADHAELAERRGVLILRWPIVGPLPNGTFEVKALLRRGQSMSDIGAPFTNEQLTELALTQAESANQTGKALAATAHQTIAGLVMNALLLHELERLGLVEHDALRAEAVERARSIRPPEVGASVARVIKTIFDGVAAATPSADLTSVNGHRTDANH
ncbi:hypothetical protein U8607_22445 [Methylobacterium durans]|uniref:hypothetical protein n=1 Tax=Methylobacterium durans TaxID=2202825 RepID=UPI002AFFECA0|nr:hypothetical protein [Methylobacterium durans]MEA1834858.1 hypothetical protein [Methylobacterium durans]